MPEMGNRCPGYDQDPAREEHPSWRLVRAAAHVWGYWRMPVVRNVYLAADLHSSELQLAVPDPRERMQVLNMGETELHRIPKHRQPRRHERSVAVHV